MCGKTVVSEEQKETDFDSMESLGNGQRDLHSRCFLQRS